jgi:hypothetical protein
MRDDLFSQRYYQEIENKAVRKMIDKQSTRLAEIEQVIKKRDRKNRDLNPSTLIEIIEFKLFKKEKFYADLNQRLEQVIAGCKSTMDTLLHQTRTREIEIAVLEVSQLIGKASSLLEEIKHKESKLF